MCQLSSRPTFDNQHRSLFVLLLTSDCLKFECKNVRGCREIVSTYKDFCTFSGLSDYLCKNTCKDCASAKSFISRTFCVNIMAKLLRLLLIQLAWKVFANHFELENFFSLDNAGVIGPVAR